MSITTDKQRQALEASGWTLDDVSKSISLVGERWADNTDASFPAVDLWSDNTLGIDGFIDRHRLAEFLSIINDESEDNA